MTDLLHDFRPLDSGFKSPNVAAQAQVTNNAVDAQKPLLTMMEKLRLGTAVAHREAKTKAGARFGEVFGQDSTQSKGFFHGFCNRG